MTFEEPAGAGQGGQEQLLFMSFLPHAYAVPMCEHNTYVHTTRAS